MIRFTPITALKREKILKWLGRIEYAEFQKMVDILIEEQFTLVQQREIADPVAFLTSHDITSNSKKHIEQAMRLRICSEVLEEVMSGKLELKTINHGSPDKTTENPVDNPAA